MPQSPDIGQNSDGYISDIQISCQSLIKDKFNNFRTNDSIGIKLGPETKPDNRNIETSKKFDDDIMSKNCDVTVLLPIYSKYGGIRNPDSGRIVCKTYISSNSNLLSNKK